MAATWTEIKDLRLRICDPSGVISIVAVANAAALPASPLRQTAYMLQDTGDYQIYDVDLATWESVNLEIADAVLDNLITLYGAAKAAPRALKAIAASVGRKLVGIARASMGAESVDFINLSTLYGFYKDLAASMEEEAKVDEGNNVGRYRRIRSPRIGGGM